MRYKMVYSANKIDFKVMTYDILADGVRVGTAVKDKKDTFAFLPHWIDTPYILFSGVKMEVLKHKVASLVPEDYVKR